MRRVSNLVAKRNIPAREDAILFSLSADGLSSSGLGPSPVVDSLVASTPMKQKKTIVVFADGTIVGWNATRADLGVVAGYCGTPNTEVACKVSESAKYVFEPAVVAADENDAVSATPMTSASGDDGNTFVIADDSDELKIPFSFALSQSVKLDMMDVDLKPIIANVKDWQRELSSTGRLSCNVKQLRRTKTQLLAVCDEMNFAHGVQTTPKLFWTAEFQPLRGHYKAARASLEVDERYEVLGDRIHAVNEALDYLHDEVHTETNELLTWVIIWLIVVEIVLALGLHTRVLSAMH